MSRKKQCGREKDWGEQSQSLWTVIIPPLSLSERAKSTCGWENEKPERWSTLKEASHSQSSTVLKETDGDSRMKWDIQSLCEDKVNHRNTWVHGHRRTMYIHSVHNVSDNPGGSIFKQPLSSTSWENLGWKCKSICLMGCGPKYAKWVRYLNVLKVANQLFKLCLLANE